MGCDYYIYKKLHIYYNENEYLDIEIKREQGYYQEDGTIDSDDENSEDIWKEYLRFTFTPKIKPIILYDGTKWNKPEAALKYKNIIEKSLKEYKMSMPNVIKIVKVEERQQR